MNTIFYEPIKVKTLDTNILVWGCPHFHHECKNWATPLWKTRGYNTLEEHDEGLIKNWNDKANSETVGFLLGDIMFGSSGERGFENTLRRLKFRTLYVLPGNHQAGWRQLFQKTVSETKSNVWKDGDRDIIFVPNYLEAFINSQPVVMSHYPILSWNGQAKGSYMLFSHVHGNLEKSEVGRVYVNSKCRALEMSVEKWPSPASFKEIKEAIGKREPVSFDHHDSSTQNPF